MRGPRSSHRSAVRRIRLEPLEARFLLSAAPGIDEPLLLDPNADLPAGAIPTATELGETDFLEIADLDLTAADHWYCGQTTHEGYLTVEARFQGSPDEVEVRLYDASLNELATSSASEAGQRIDCGASAGQTYYFSVTGDSADVDLRVANLVHQDKHSVTVHGTSGDDRFEFTAGESHQVAINGVNYEFASRTVKRLQFHGGAGDDTAVLLGSAGTDHAEMHPFQAELKGPGYRVVVDGAAHIEIMGQGGNDVARLYDSVGDDQFLATPSYARLYGDGFDNHAFGFRYAHGYSLRGGTDVARLLDDPGGRDTFQAWPHQARLFGDGFYNRVRSFRYVHAYATTGGSDVAKFYDDPSGRDLFEAWPHMARLSGSHYYNRAKSFRYVHAYGTTGSDDVALLNGDPDAADTFEAWPSMARLYGPGYYNRVNSFRWVHGYGTPGNEDAARLFGSAGDDTLLATDRISVLSGDGFYNRAVLFEQVEANGGGGTDTARLYDAVLESGLVHLSNAKAILWLYQFDQINQVDTETGEDTSTAAADKIFTAYWP